MVPCAIAGSDEQRMPRTLKSPRNIVVSVQSSGKRGRRLLVIHVIYRHYFLRVPESQIRPKEAVRGGVRNGSPRLVLGARMRLSSVTFPVREVQNYV